MPVDDCGANKTVFGHLQMTTQTQQAGVEHEFCVLKEKST